MQAVACAAPFPYVQSSMADPAVKISYDLYLEHDGQRVHIPESLVVKDPLVLKLLVVGHVLKCGPPKWTLASITTCPQDSNGEKYLKMMATNQAICKLICGKTAKNASLSGGQKLQGLKDQRNKALQANKEEDWEDEGKQGEEPPQKKLKVLEEKVLKITVDDVEVTILCPQKRASTSDLLVQLDGGMLCAVFKHLQDDCQSCTSTRSYKKTGKHKVGAKDAVQGNEG